MKSDLKQKIHQILPQTQCTRCQYPTCDDYAGAVAQKNEATNKCVPGGLETSQIISLIKKTGDVVANFDKKQAPEYKSAQIIESECIGCTLCIKACPFDAIIGSRRRMHTVLTSDCSGCELCVPACPVDCIEIKSLEQLQDEGNIHAQALLKMSYAETGKKNLSIFMKSQKRRKLKKEEESARETKRSSNQSPELKKHFLKNLRIERALQIAERRISQREKRIQQ